MIQQGSGFPVDRFPVSLPPAQFNAPGPSVPTGVSVDPSTVHRYHKQFPAPFLFSFYTDLLWTLPAGAWANCFEIDVVHRSGSYVQTGPTTYRPTWHVPDLYDVSVFDTNSNVPTGSNVGVTDSFVRIDDGRVLASFQPLKEPPAFDASLAFIYLITGVLSTVNGSGRAFSIRLPASQKFNQVYVRAWYLQGFQVPGIVPQDFTPFMTGRAWFEPNRTAYDSES